MRKPNTHMCDCERQTEKLPPDIAKAKDYWPIVASGNSSSVTSSFEAHRQLVIPGGHSSVRAIAVIQLIDASKLRAKSDFALDKRCAAWSATPLYSISVLKRNGIGSLHDKLPDTSRHE